MKKRTLKEGVPSVTVDGILVGMKVDEGDNLKFYKFIYMVHKTGQRLCFETHSPEIASQIIQSGKNGNKQFRVTAKIKSLKIQKGYWEGRWISKLEIKEIEPITWGKVEEFDWGELSDRLSKLGVGQPQSLISSTTEKPLVEKLEEPSKEMSPERIKKELDLDLGDNFKKVTSDMLHTCLDYGVDKCYFLGHYAPKKGAEYSETNRLVKGLKRNDAQAIREIAHKFKSAIIKRSFTRKVFVPVPSSSQDDPKQKDRIEKLLWEVNDNDLKVRKYIRQTKSTVPNHKRDPNNRMTAQELEEIYEVVGNNRPDAIAIVDDVLTTGAHFRAMGNKLKESMPNVSIIGLFIARTMRKNEFDGGTDTDINDDSANLVNTKLDDDAGTDSIPLDLEKDLPW